MKTILLTISFIVIIIITAKSQENDSLMLRDKAAIKEVQSLIIDTQKKLQNDTKASLSREDQLYMLDLFSEVTRIALSFYPPDSSKSKVIISDKVKEQMEKMIRKDLEKLEKVKTN